MYTEKQSRVSKGNIVPVVFYSLQQIAEGSDFSRYQDDDQFLSCYIQVLKNTDRYKGKTASKSLLTRTINGMKRLLWNSGSHRVEAFLSFTEIDFNMFCRLRDSKTQLTFKGVELFQEAIRLYRMTENY